MAPEARMLFAKQRNGRGLGAASSRSTSPAVSASPSGKLSPGEAASAALASYPLASPRYYRRAFQARPAPRSERLSASSTEN